MNKVDPSTEVNPETVSDKIERASNNNQKFSSNQNDDSEQYPIVNPNLLEIEGPDVTLVFKKTQAKEIFEYLAQIANYGFVWVRDNPTNKKDLESQRLITLTLNDVSYQRAFNALLLASGLQAKLYNNVLYIGPNVRNTVFPSRSTGVYQLNQISASSAADYLANLGASVTKTYTIKTSVTQGATQSQAVQGGSTSSTTTDQSETSVKVYGATIGPLVGLIATTDERLQTVTMVGEKTLIDLASVFLQRLDKRQKQVALSVRVLDVNLTDKDSFTNTWGTTFSRGSPFIIGKGGLIKSAIGTYTPEFAAPEKNPGQAYPRRNSFFGLLEASIEKGSTKVLASPTLLLSESSGTAGDGKEIGREFGNEGFVEVGDKVAVDATYADGACNFTYGLVGVKLGAKVLGIDQNQFITFTMSPVVSGISSSLTITGCGEVSILNTRRVDTGAVRIKDGETLVLTGVIQDTDIEKLYKYPLLGDMPILGPLFRSKNNEYKKRELIVLATPRILNDSGSNVNRYDFEFSDKESNKIIEELE
ncbi:type II secretory pathway protein [Prochlorococcus sp. MIT 1307]|uniref:type II secretion system protein GspD n=1 Tax=Prochlorococcus sp. MIT 1307 TaxID=3096219 RepID=UPI002A763F87|nr:type II secretory pathway protein [Prochlorococcus sp. MIT 1307]